MPLLIGAAFLLNITVWSQTSTQADADQSGQASVQTNRGNAQVSTSASSSSSVAAQSGQGNGGLAAGIAFNATLTTSVDSRKAKPGDEVTARTTENVRADGKTVLPKKTKLIGHVTQASARGKGDAASALGIAFDRAILKDGKEVPLNLTIQALASAQSSVSAASDDMGTMADTSAGMGASGMAGARGAVGGVTSTVGSGLGTVTNTAGRVGQSGESAATSTLNSASGVAGPSQAVGGLNASGQFSSSSQGVFNLNGLSLSSTASSESQASLVTSAGKNVHLDSGTRMLLVTQAGASATRN